MAMKRLCVYCGSRMGDRPAYREAAALVGAELARRGVGLVYGGGRIGLMGVVADACLRGGGEVIGVIPGGLFADEIAHTGTDLRVVGSMHERKALMASLSDAFLALPGGIGTFEEFFETLTWAQLGIHTKPIGLLDVGGYYGPLLEMIERCESEGFLRRQERSRFTTGREAVALLDLLLAPEAH